MSVVPNPTDRPSAGETNARNISAVELVADAVNSLSTPSSSESVADEFDIGIHNDKHDFDNHVKVAVREGLDPYSSLAELADKTAVDETLEHMSKSRFSELTNDRDYRAVVRLLFALLHTPQLYHERAAQRKRLEWLTRGVIAADATNLDRTRSVVVSDEFVGDDEHVYSKRDSPLHRPTSDFSSYSAPSLDPTHVPSVRPYMTWLRWKTSRSSCARFISRIRSRMIRRPNIESANP